MNLRIFNFTSNTAIFVNLSSQSYNCKRFYNSKLRLSGLCQSLSLSALIYTSHLHQHLFLAPENSSSLPALLLLTPAPVSSSLTLFSDFYSSLTPSRALSPSPITPHWVQTSFKGRGSRGPSHWRHSVPKGPCINMPE